MKTTNKITLKVVFSYLLLVLLSVIVGIIIFGEIEKLTTQEKINETDKGNIVKISKILALMYETESAGRIAVQSESNEALFHFIDKNNTLQANIKNLKNDVSSNSHRELLDSVQTLLELKTKNIEELKAIQRNDSSSTVIRSAIHKLSSLEPSMGDFLLNDNGKTSEQQNEKKNSEIGSILKKYENIEVPPLRYQKDIDSVILQTRKLLSQVQRDVSKHKMQQNVKTEVLWQNDIRISEKLKELLYAFEADVLQSSQQLTNERRQTVEKSRSILTMASIVAIILIAIFSLIILNDFWKAQKFRQELEAANHRSQNLLKSREQLISMVSHDLRTPLSTIVGYSELLKKQNVPEKEKNYVTHISNASQYVTKLVDELLDYTKLEAGKVAVEKVPFQFFDLILEVAHSVQSVYADKPIELQINVSDFIKNNRFSSDSYRIKQILYNLVSNAFKFTEKGTISVSVDAKPVSDERFEISFAVKDTGIGIKKQQQLQIFDEFTQADSSISKRYGGSGLGLHISQKLAHLLKGEIDLKSKEGEGSTFTFRFIADKINAQKKAKKQWVSDKKPDELTLIAIDDNNAILELLNELLKRKDIKVIPFNNGKEALSAMQNLTFDMVITDIQLPEMNGFHFVTLFNECYKNTPVLAITGRKDVPENYYTENGFAGMLHKPFQPEQFYEKIHFFFPKLNYNEHKKDMALDNHTTYHPEVLEQFMGDDKQGISSVLEIFMTDTQKNIAQLELSANEKNYHHIRETAHKMLSMFKQIGAEKEAEIIFKLNKIEDEDKKEVHQLIQQLKKLYNEFCLPAIEVYYKSIS